MLACAAASVSRARLCGAAAAHARVPRTSGPRGVSSGRCCSRGLRLPLCGSGRPVGRLTGPAGARTRESEAAAALWAMATRGSVARASGPRGEHRPPLQPDARALQPQGAALGHACRLRVLAALARPAFSWRHRGPFRRRRVRSSRARFRREGPAVVLSSVCTHSHR